MRSPPFHINKRIKTVLIALCLLIFFLLFWFLIKDQEASLKQNTHEALKGILNSTHESLILWIEIETEAIQHFNYEIRDQWNQGNYHKAAEALEHELRYSHFPSYILLLPDLSPLIPMGQGQIQKLEIIRQYRMDCLIQAQQGEDTWIPVILYNEYPVMYIASPLLTDDHVLTGILLIEIDYYHSFSNYLKIGLLSDTGETYLFDQNGRLLSESRFLYDLVHYDLIPSGKNSIFNLEIRDPGGDITEGYRPPVPRNEQDFTYMIQSALSEGSGFSIDRPYNDYRGVPVYGVWTWNETYNFGIATEIDTMEILVHLDRSVLTIVMIFLFTIAIASINAILVFRMNSDRELFKKRTYQKFLTLFENSPDGILIFSPKKNQIKEGNSASVKLFELESKQDLLKADPIDLILNIQETDQLNRATINSLIKECQQSGSTSFHWTLKIKELIIPSTVDLFQIQLEGEELIQLSIRNIAEKVEAEKQVVASESRLKEVQRLGHIGNWYWNLKNHTISRNEEVSRIFNLDTKSNYSGSIDFLRMIPPEDRDSVIKGIQHARRYGTPIEMTHRIILPNGLEKYINYKGLFQYNYQNQPVSASGTVQDVTELKQTKRELQQYKDQLEQLVSQRTMELINAKEQIQFEKSLSDNIIDSLPNLFFLLNKDREILRVNRNFQRLTGYHPDEIHKKNFLDFFLNPDQANRMIQPVSMNTITQFEADLIQSNGDPRPFLISATKTIDKGNTQIICSATDLYDLRIAMNEIRKLSQVVEQSPTIILITDTEGNIQYVNPAFSEMTGYGNSEVIGQNPRILKSGKMTEEFYQTMWQTILAGKVWSGEIINKKKNGELYWEYVSISAIRDHNDRIINFFAVEENITERKKMELDLLKAKEQAEVSARVKSKFLANMSHEIRTPMNSIIGFIELVLEERHFSHDEKHYLQTALNSAKDLLILINDILDVSKLESGKLKIINAPFNIRSLLNIIIEITKQLIKEKSIDLKLEIRSDLSQCISGDKNRIRQVLLNLLGNAVKFTQKGSVTLSCQDMRNGFLRFQIQDTGIGMTETQIERIFDPFTQADESTVRRYGGTGLGTTISKELVALMGGEITVDSQPNIGTTFTFTLPNIPAECPEEYDPECEELVDLSPVPVESNGRYYNLLLAEDIEENIKLIVLRMEKLGHRVTAVTNGLDAVHAVKNGIFDMILMDIHMPVLDGLDATRQIRGMGISTPIIALTASVMEEEINNCKTAGMDEIVSKPVILKDLLNTIERIIPPDSGSTTPFMTEEESAELQPDPGEIPPDFKILPGIDFEQGLQNWQDRYQYISSLKGFRKKYGNGADQILQKLKTGETEQAYNIAHAIKGVAGNLSLTEIEKELSRVCIDLKTDKNLLEQNREVILEKALGETFKTAMESIDQLDHNDQGNEIPGDTTDLSQVKLIIEELLILSQRGEVEEESLNRLWNISREILLPKEKQQIRESMEIYNFKAMTEILSAIHQRVLEQL